MGWVGARNGLDAGGGVLGLEVGTRWTPTWGTEGAQPVPGSAAWAKVRAGREGASNRGGQGPDRSGCLRSSSKLYQRLSRSGLPLQTRKYQICLKPGWDLTLGGPTGSQRVFTPHPRLRVRGRFLTLVAVAQRFPGGFWAGPQNPLPQLGRSPA